MRRYLPLILFVIVLFAPLLVSPKAPARGELRLVIVTPHVEGIKREFAEAFSAWHESHFGKPVFVDYRSYGGTSEIVRFFETASRTLYAKTGTYKIDVVWGGGDYLFEQQLKKPGYLEGVRLPASLFQAAYPSRQLDGVDLYDASSPPQWFGAALSSFGIIYNRDVLQYLGTPEPKSWHDLADARLLGWIVAADPARSASAKYLFMIIVERAMLVASQRGDSEDAGWAQGMGLVRLIASNARYFTDAGSLVPNVVASGDAGAGMAIDFFGRAEVDAVGKRLGYVEPAGETIITSDPIALVKGAEHRELAIRFIEFVLSEQGQRLWNTRAGAPGGPRLTSLRRLPIMQSVYRSPANFTDPVDPFTTTFAYISDPHRKRTFNILGDLIEVSCINLLEDLRATRRAINASPRRAQLEA
ncbi:MAG: ABC transporter substrate-binding protein, partial [Tepidisphaeraceae bacterium]